MTFIIIGVVLFLIGAATGWMAANSPVQLHPIPLIGLGLGSLMILFGLGGVVPNIIPGTLAGRVAITPVCRENRGSADAFDEAAPRRMMHHEARPRHPHRRLSRRHDRLLCRAGGAGDIGEGGVMVLRRRLKTARQVTLLLTPGRRPRFLPPRTYAAATRKA